MINCWNLIQIRDQTLQINVIDLLNKPFNRDQRSIKKFHENKES